MSGSLQSTLAAYGLATLCLAASLAATHPTVSSLYPRGARRGTEITVNLYGARLQRIQGLVFLRSGIEVLSVKGERSTRALVKLRIAKDCPLGAHRFFVRTDRGLSNLKLFFVGSLPEVSEKEPNNDRGSAQKVPLNVTINGRIRNEDIDCFAVPVHKGQRVNIEVEALRLCDREFDTHLTIRDDKGKKLASIDDTIFGKMDPLASITAERDGTLYLYLRENALGGSDSSFYRMHVGTFPRPFIAFPPGGKPGAKIQVRLIGAGGSRPAEFTLPNKVGIHDTFVSTPAGTSPTPIKLVATNNPNVLEAAYAKHAPGIGISSWQVAGPFANKDAKGKVRGHAFVYPPEKGVDLEARYVGRDGKVEWIQRKDFRDNTTIDLRRVIKNTNDSVTYLARTLTAATARRVLLLFSGDDTVRIWLNRKRILDAARASRITAGQHRLILDLKKGKNDLLVKIANRSGPCGFHCRILDPLRYANYTPLPIPAAINGIIAKEQEQDRFLFLARRGEAIDFQVISRRLRSPLDPVAYIYCTHERYYLGNDDQRGMGLDSLLRFRAPFTGEFVLGIRDMLLTAGPGHVYRVEVTRPTARPLALRATLPGYRYEYTINIPKGGRDALMLTASNLDQNAGVKLAFENLPTGVTATMPSFARGLTSIPVVFHATADAALGGHLLAVEAKATKKQLDLSSARYYQPVEVVQARNQQTYLREVIERLPAAVTNRSPFTIDVAPIKVPLCRSSSLRVPFKIKRAGGFTGSVRVRMLYNPSGVTSSQTTVSSKKDSGYLSLYANGGARTGVQKIVLVGMATVLGAPISSSSELVDLEVSTAWMTASLGSIRTEPGTERKLAATFRAVKPFKGKITPRWVGLPRGVTCKPFTVQRTTKQLEMDFTIDKKAPPGRHRGFRLRLSIATENGPVVQDFRSGEIRIDRPRPKAKKVRTKATKTRTGS